MTSRMNIQPEIPEDQHHPRFFFPEEFITFKVDAIYFKLPTYHLKKHSKKLQELIDQPKPDVATLEVQGITVVDLERFLAIIFPVEYGQFDATSFEEWESILKVAQKWECNYVVKLAIDKIEPLCSPVDKVVIGKCFNIPEWAVEGRVRLCQRTEPISLEEALRLGIEEVVNISTIRHHIHSPETPSGIPDSAIRSVLSGELAVESIKKIVMDISPPVHVVQDAARRGPTSIQMGLSAFTGVQERTGSSIIKQDRKISRALELRNQRSAMKERLALLQERKEQNRVVRILDSDKLVQEIGELELQMDGLEDKYMALYRGYVSYSPWVLDNLVIQKFDYVQSVVESRLRMALHPDAPSPISFVIAFSQDCKKKESMKQETLDVLESYGIEYKTEETRIIVQVP